MPKGVISSLFEAEIASIRREIDTRFEALQEATNKRDQAFEKRMDGTNEWRGALQDLSTKQASKESVDAIDIRVKKLEAASIKTSSSGETRGQIWAIIVSSIATASIMIGVALAIFAAIS